MGSRVVYIGAPITGVNGHPSRFYCDHGNNVYESIDGTNRKVGKMVGKNGKAILQVEEKYLKKYAKRLKEIIPEKENDGD